MIEDVIEERMCELIRESEKHEADNNRVMVNMHPRALEELDALAKSLGLSRAEFGGRLLEAAVSEAKSVYQREKETA
ncbi:MAG TPA: hypothetical protein VKA48_11375 [Gammaproteobacteria bacterium]|nr:hypothetical protein [Gammaproteobacteria bacterium]